MPDWSIKIIPNPAATADKPALLKPDLVGAKPGDPLRTQEGDQVSWNNETSQPYQPWPTDGSYKPLAVGGVTPPPAPLPFPNPSPAGSLSDMIPGHLSSTPAYNVFMPANGNVTYYCLLDAKGNPTKVCGQIIVTAMTTALNVPPVKG
jgi:hypothetical protein